MSKKRSKLGWPKLSPKDRKEPAALSGQDNEGSQEEVLELPKIFESSIWYKVFNIFGAAIILSFNVSLIGADIHTLHPQLLPRIMAYVLLAMLDVTLLLPIILEVNKAEVKGNTITLRTMIWQWTVAWADIRSFSNNPWFKFALVRTRRSCYLINKRRIKRFEELATIISEHVPSTATKGKS